MNPASRFCNVEARRQGIGATVITTSVTTAAAAASNETNSNSKPSSSENSVEPKGIYLYDVRGGRGDRIPKKEMKNGRLREFYSVNL